MRCRPGDLAFIVRSSFPENVRKLVRVIERDPACIDGLEIPDWCMEALQPLMTSSWTADGSFLGNWAVPAGHRCHTFDADLQPIRPGEEPDETLTWAGLPADQRKTVEA